jgi:hypothetical protein
MNAILRPAPPQAIVVGSGLAFLQFASARLVLVEAGEMGLEQALVELIEPFEDLFGRSICRRCLEAEDARRRLEQQRLARPATPQTTIEAVLHCVRERGAAALKEPANVERLSRCDAASRQQINSRIKKLIETKRITAA